MPIEKLKKVVDMATRGGTEGERDNAKRIVFEQCKIQGFNYVEIIAGRFPEAKPLSDMIDDLNEVIRRRRGAQTSQAQAAQSQASMNDINQAQRSYQKQQMDPLYAAAFKRQRSEQDIANGYSAVRAYKERIEKHRADLRARVSRYGGLGSSL